MRDWSFQVPKLSTTGLVMTIVLNVLACSVDVESTNAIVLDAATADALIEGDAMVFRI